MEQVERGRVALLINRPAARPGTVYDIRHDERNCRTCLLRTPKVWLSETVEEVYAFKKAMTHIAKHKRLLKTLFMPPPQLSKRQPVNLERWPKKRLAKQGRREWLPLARWPKVLGTAIPTKRCLAIALYVSLYLRTSPRD